MKRVLTVAFSVLILCCLLLLNMGMVKASQAGYAVSEAYDTVAVTLNGNWATGEWEDSWIEYMDASAARERFCYKASSALAYAPEILIDSADTTNDTGDIWQICIGVPVDTGGVPTSGQNKIEIVGHKTLTVYQGNGTGWQAMATSSVTWANSLTIHAAPFNYTHWCVEMIIDKSTLNQAWNGAPPIGLRVAFYDASKQSWIAWPPQSNPDIPGGWGLITGGNPSIPESLSFGVVVVTSSVAVAVSFFCLRKRPKTQSYNFGKTGE
jgi:hypothetical protein